LKMVPALQPAVQCLHDNAAFPHVLIVVDSLAEPIGGGERIILKLASLLPDYGYRVSILTFHGPIDAEVRASPPCPIYFLPLTSAFNVSALRAAFCLRRFLRDHDVAIVQTFFESSDLWAGLVTKVTSSARLIWSRRDMGILRLRKHRLAYRVLADMPDRVFAVAELVRKHCIEVDRIDPRKVDTIYNGLDPKEWSPIPSSPRTNGEIHITTVGHVRHVKGHDVFVRAAAEIAKRHPEATFSIAGAALDSAYFQYLQTLIRDLGLTHRFYLAGAVRDMQSHLAQSDIFVLPSRSEGFSNAIVEAMGMSLPVVATDVGGNAEAVSHGVNGFIVQPDDPQAVAEAILRLLDDPGRARAMGEVGRQMVREQFTIGTMMNCVTRAYGEVLACGAPAHSVSR